MFRPVRYTFIVAVVAVATSLAAAGGWKYARASAPVSGPIIVISVDTLRADHLSAYGYKRLRTPAIDALAADGVLFERAYSHSPQTLPSHVSLLSGRLPFETGVRDDIGFTVKPSVRMLPQLLHDRGFATGGVVSSFFLRKETGVAQGFDFFDGVRSADRRDGSESETLAERWLDRVGTSRAFLFLHLYEPHLPYQVPERLAGDDPYDGAVAYADEIIGKLVKYLKGHQLYDRSTIILLSDHGEGLGDHGVQEHGVFLYEEVVHVPLIVKQEGNAGAGRRVDNLVQHIDIVPTVLDLVKAPQPGNLRGRSLKPLLDGGGHLDPAFIYSEALHPRYQFGWSELVSLTSDRFRYVRAPREEFYDLRLDPKEQTNLATTATVEQALAQMRRTLDGMVRGVGVEPPVVLSLLATNSRERLKALGYVQVTAPEAGSLLADPKDKIETLSRYQSAIGLGEERKWPAAIALLQQIVRSDPTTAAWAQLADLATRSGRLELAVDAYRHYTALEPDDAGAHLAAAATLMRVRRFTEATEHANRAREISAERDPRSHALADEMLAKIALAQHDAEEARRIAHAASEAAQARPLTPFVEARLLYDDGKYEEALPLFEQSIEQSKRADALQIGEVHYYCADTLERLERYDEAEAEYAEELSASPESARARAGLATLYQATGRSEDATRTLDEMIEMAPTPESYALAARLLTSFGDRRRADAVRAQAHRAFGQP